MPFVYSYVFPVLQGIVLFLTFFTTYLVATIINKDVPAIFPYVSDTGVWSIERCIFTFMLGFGALLMLATIYVRYRQVKETLGTNENADFQPNINRLNTISLYLAAISEIGMFTVASFPVYPYLVIHLTGAVTAFSFGWLVLLIQTYISFKIYPALGNKSLNICRAVLIAIITIALGCCGLFGLLSFREFKGSDITQWTKESGGYELHLISVFNEWILVFGVVLYLTMYTKEFKSVVFYKPKIKLVET